MIKNLRNKCKNKKGFTMVELIVVIVIILVLAAVLVPSLLRYIDKANQANCKADGATIMSQVQADVADALGTAETKADVTLPDVQVGDVTASSVEAITINAEGDGKVAEYVVELEDADTYGDVTAFAYQDGKHWVTWTAADGWKLDGEDQGDGN